MRRMIMMFNLVALALTSSVIAEQERDLWYAISIAGARSGWLHETRSQVPEGWQTEQESKIEIRRGAQSVAMEVTSRFVEDANGKPILGADGRPLTLPPCTIGPGGVVLDADGNPVIGADGKTIAMSEGAITDPRLLNDPRIPPGGSIGASSRVGRRRR